MTAQTNILETLFTDDFAAFWSSYPRKEGKKDALKAFIQTRKQGYALAKIMDGLASYRIQCSRSDLKFVKLAGGWLRDARFEDETQIASPDASKPLLPHQAKKLFDPTLYHHPQAAQPGTLRSVAEILASRK